MNLLLLAPEELDPSARVTLTGRRAVHALEVLKASEGDQLKVGVRGGLRGQARVVSKSRDSIELEVGLTDPPPPRPGLDLILAMPRPKQLKRVLSAVASIGFDRLVLINAAKVEKSYFDSKVLAPGFIDGLLALGLEQAMDTVAPVVELRQRFKPFVEDELDGWAPKEASRWVLHPAPGGSPTPAAGRKLIAIGPEGGWVPFEIDLLSAHGFSPLSLGSRPYRTEVVVPLVAGMLAGNSPA